MPPPGVVRAGIAHSHHPDVYSSISPYAPFLDLLGGVSRTIEENLKALAAFSRVRVRYLPYGVPMPELVASSPPAKDSALRILYLGRLDQEQKRVRLFPTILQKLVASGIPFSWTLAGDGRERSYLEENMKPLLPTQTVRFLGPVSYSEVPALLKEHDVMLLASDYEGLPLSLAEAMGCGVVPVVSDLSSGVRELVDEQTGILVHPDKVEGYAEGIIHLHRDRDMLKIMSKAAQNKVRKEFSVGAMTDRWLAALPAEAPGAVWTGDCIIKTPLMAKHPVYFSPPFRTLRRIAASFRTK